MIRAATEPTLGDKPADQLTFKEGRLRNVLYRGGWDFRLAAEESAKAQDVSPVRRRRKNMGRVTVEVPGEYEVVGVRREDMKPYSPPPNLVISFAGLTRSKESPPPPSPTLTATARAHMRADLPSVAPLALAVSLPKPVDPTEMRNFLEEWGPLDTGENSPWLYLFSEPADMLAEVLELADDEDLLGALKLALRLYQTATPGSLLSVLTVQTLACLFRGELPKRCPDCRKFFFESSDHSTSGQRRRSSKYCDKPCRDRSAKRRQRERQKAAAAASA